MPRWFLFENVPAIRSHRVFGQIAQRFESLRTTDGAAFRYVMFDGVYSAADYGVPQNRRRFIRVGYRADLALDKWVSPKKFPGPKVRWALGDLPPIESGTTAATIHYGTAAWHWYARMMRRNVGLGAQAKATFHICRKHNVDDTALFAEMKPGAKFADPEVQAIIPKVNPSHKLLKYSTEKFADKLHRLDPNRVAWTVTAHLQKDCYKFIHYRDARTISVREAARLQSFPDHFSFGRTKMGPAFRMIGNAVPPLLARAFAESFIASDATLAWRRRELAARALPDDLWVRLERLWPQCRPARGRKPLNKRNLLVGILYVLGSGIPWDLLPTSLQSGAGSTCRNYYERWKAIGEWDRIQEIVRQWASEHPAVSERTPSFWDLVYSPENTAQVLLHLVSSSVRISVCKANITCETATAS